VTIAAAAPHPVHIHKPWRQSTGPRTARGKAISRMNALKHGRRSAAVMAERRTVKHYLRVQAEFLKQVRQLLRLQRSGVIKQQSLKSTNELFRSLFVSARLMPLTCAIGGSSDAADHFLQIGIFFLHGGKVPPGQFDQQIVNLSRT
jgi:hypothetical protein